MRFRPRSSAHQLARCTGFTEIRGQHNVWWVGQTRAGLLAEYGCSVHYPKHSTTRLPPLRRWMGLIDAKLVIESRG